MEMENENGNVEHGNVEQEAAPPAAQESRDPNAITSFSVHIRQYKDGKMVSTRGRSINARLPEWKMLELFQQLRRAMKDSELEFEEVRDTTIFKAAAKT